MCLFGILVDKYGCDLAFGGLTILSVKFNRHTHHRIYSVKNASVQLVLLSHNSISLTCAPAHLCNYPNQLIMQKKHNAYSHAEMSQELRLMFTSNIRMSKIVISVTVV